jgi:hypothetical protein
VFCFSDGASASFKSRFTVFVVCVLVKLKYGKDRIVYVFHASGEGRGIYDAHAGTIKAMARREALAGRPTKGIAELVAFVNAHVKASVAIDLTADVEALGERPYRDLTEIKGMKSQHVFMSEATVASKKQKDSQAKRWKGKYMYSIKSRRSAKETDSWSETVIGTSMEIKKASLCPVEEAWWPFE